MLIVIQTLRNRKLVRTKFRFMSSVRYSVLNRYLGLEVPKLVDLIDTNMSFSVINIKYNTFIVPRFIRGQRRPHPVFYKFVNKKINSIWKKLLRKVDCVFSVKKSYKQWDCILLREEKVSLSSSCFWMEKNKVMDTDSDGGFVETGPWEKGNCMVRIN